MSATTIFFNGRVISVPGSYSEVDASGLEQVGLGATGIVAVLGTAEGGEPSGEMEETKDFIRINNPEQGKSTFKSGDLREVMDMLFAPAKDPDILGGAVQVVAMKVNPATQSTATFANGEGDSLVVTSVDWGAFTAQINVSIADGTNQGKLLTIVFEDVTESVDDLGADPIFSLEYRGGSNGYTTVVAEVISGGSIKVTATKTSAGGSTSITQLAGNDVVEVLSSNIGDTTQTLTIYGLDAGGLVQEEDIALNGTSVVTGLLTFSKVYGGVLDAVTAGTVTARKATGDATIFTIAPAALRAAATLLEYGFVNSTTLSLAGDAATTKNIILVGKNASGAHQLKKYALTGTTPVVTTSVNWSSLDLLVVGDLEAARTLTVTAEAAKAVPTVQSTIQKAADYYNAKQTQIAGPLTRGFILNLATGGTQFLLSDLDVTPSTQDIKDLGVDFYADLFTIIDWINTHSQYITAEASVGASGGAPSNTANPVFLAGGDEGTATFADYQNALNLLKKTRVNSIAVLSADPAVAAALDAHCAFMGGIGRSERDGFVGLMNAGLDDVPSKTEAKDQVVDLNTRHVRAWAQAFEHFNSSGERVEFTPPFGAAILAGMQAGSPIGTSLTHKFMNLLSLRQDSSWNPVDDAEEMVRAGVVFAENVEGVGRRVVRNVTTHLSTNNIAFVEASVNNAVNFAVFNFRTNMEFAVGKRGFSGTVNAAKGVAIGTLGLLKDAGVLVASRSLAITLTVDVLEVSVEIAPVIPINFVKNTIHLVTIQQAAA